MTRSAPWTASSPTRWSASPRASPRAGSLSRLNGLHCRPTLSGRQTLWMIYKEFERDDATTDHIAHGHLERMTFSGKDEHLEAFVNSWDALMLTFKTKPTESHLYSALMSRLKKLPGLATTVAHLDRQVNGHPDRCFDFLDIHI